LSIFRSFVFSSSSLGKQRHKKVIIVDSSRSSQLLHAHLSIMPTATIRRRRLSRPTTAPPASPPRRFCRCYWWHHLFLPPIGMLGFLLVFVLSTLLLLLLPSSTTLVAASTSSAAAAAAAPAPSSSARWISNAASFAAGGVGGQYAYLAAVCWSVGFSANACAQQPLLACSYSTDDSLSCFLLVERGQAARRATSWVLSVGQH